LVTVEELVVIILDVLIASSSCGRGAFFLHQCFCLAFCQFGERASACSSFTWDGSPNSQQAAEGRKASSRLGRPVPWSLALMLLRYPK
jgi:hypothetical protein